MTRKEGVVREDYPTEPETRRNFEELLGKVRAGGAPHSDSGLDLTTEEALWDITRAYPEVPDELVAAARAAFEGQLDGSNAAARRAERARKIEAINRRRSAP
ncbi:hypothetical protein [Nocardia asteroides]|uniref:hypothetical protein n=1 Tax=Nocardia asteroides TaxID=1824 RepID=UPI001E561189|nr:hypothetical protein [Nocardia asteroides]UGT59996.1 hypothetical protein LTT61_22605 [Nocardia asteroides]